MIKDPSFITYRLGAGYSHFRGDWLFCFDFHFDNFKFGADWYINRWQIQDLNLYFGFFELSWSRLYAKVKKCKKNTKKTGN